VTADPLAAFTLTLIYLGLSAAARTQVGLRPQRRGRIAVESKSNRSFDHRIAWHASVEMIEAVKIVTLILTDLTMN